MSALRFLHPTRYKTGYFGHVCQTILLAWYGESKPNTTKARIQQSKNVLQHKINTEKLKPGLVAYMTSGLETERAYSSFCAS